MGIALSKFIENIKQIWPFAISGFSTGLLSVLFWDVDDYGLFGLALPGWIFSLGFFLSIFIKTGKFSNLSILKFLLWVIFTGGCFVAAFLIVVKELFDIGKLNLLLSGFITTFLMLMFFRVLFKEPNIFGIVKISLLAGVIAFFGFIYFKEFESIATIFLPYHILISLYFGYELFKK